MPNPNPEDPRGDRVVSGRRWAYVGAFLGGIVSIAANVGHSYVPPVGAPDGWHPHGGAVAFAIFWPVALLAAIEVLARNEWEHGARWTAVRWFGLVPVCVVAALVSYRHMSGLLAYYGDDAITAALGPVAVDGLMIMCTGAIIMTGPRTASRPRTFIGGEVRHNGHVPTTILAPPVDLSAGQHRPLTDDRPMTGDRPVADEQSVTEDALRDLARDAYRGSVRDGRPLSGAELARKFGQSNPRWGTRRITEVRAEQETGQ